MKNVSRQIGRHMKPATMSLPHCFSATTVSIEPRHSLLCVVFLFLSQSLRCRVYYIKNKIKRIKDGFLLHPYNPTRVVCKYLAKGLNGQAINNVPFTYGI